MLSKTAPWYLSAPRMISWCPLIAWRKERRSDVGRVLSRQPWAVIINVPASRAQSIFPRTPCLAQTCAVPRQPSYLYGWTSHRQLRLSRFKLAGPPTPRDTEASNAYAIIHDSLGPVCICRLIGINSKELQKDLIFAATKDIGQDLASVVIDGMPE